MSVHSKWEFKCLVFRLEIPRGIREKNQTYKAIYCKPILESLSLLLKMKNQEDSLFLSCVSKLHSWLCLILFLLSILPKKRCLLLIISKNNTSIYNMFYVDSVLTWWVDYNMLPASALYDLLGIVSSVVKLQNHGWDVAWLCFWASQQMRLVPRDNYSYNSPDVGETPPKDIKELYGYCNCSMLGRKSRPSLCSSASVTVIIALVVHDHLLSFYSCFFPLCIGCKHLQPAS